MGSEAKLYGLKSEYCQDSDSCAPDDSIQQLDIETCDAGGVIYYILSTDRWSFESIDDITKILEDFMDRSKGTCSV